jgi:hypothetical protein
MKCSRAGGAEKKQKQKKQFFANFLEQQTENKSIQN